MSQSFVIFDTDIGDCALIWGERGIVGAMLPESRVRERVARRFPDAIEAEPTGPVAQAVADVRALMRGDAADLTGVQLDYRDAPELWRRVWDIARAIPPGETLTYGDIARRLGDVALSQQVGQALGKNPIPIIVPCHRVVAAGGRTGGFSAPGGVATKMRMLSIERARTDPEPGLFGDLPLAARPAAPR
ncbi:methylated-DNA--[protein]-cysteine S-methyltransferase [Caulobacter sp. KR2-114]|uniref:methylated-DNA--[protein]-cysteine S-methyltransferase n=1 Tax=Caulobacter sp. KR2-114 TaxID=3400912 RepID=UPI003C036CAE